MYTLEDFNRRNVDDQKSLTEALSWASYKYYVENDPPMSDFEFDMEFKRLQALEASSGIVLDGSPTQRVGSDIQGAFQKRRHVIPMQSIENVYNDEELQEWLCSVQKQLKSAFPRDVISFTYEPKYDGLSISLVYIDGVLTDAVTRGNQIEGESVFENVKTIQNVPLRLNYVPKGDDLFATGELPHYFEVRGEVLMPQGAFDRLNAEKAANGEKLFANKRNAASGSLKQLDPKITARRGLLVNAYAAYSTDETFQSDVMSSQTETMHLLRELGFSMYQPDIRAYSDMSELTDAINQFNEIRVSHELPYDCDGVVIKVNERRHQEFMGLNTTFPNWCKARKFPQEAQSTIIRDVTFQVGMTGHITPVAELDPTTISGSLVSRATLNNESYIRTLNLSIGSYVFVQKAGEVIPQVSGLDEQRNIAEEVEPKEIRFPETCPSCGTPLVRKGEYYVCPNHHCREQVIQRLEFWCGKDCANIKGLGPSIIADFVDKLDIRSVDDLYRVFVKDEDEFVPADSEDLDFGPDSLFSSVATSTKSYREQIQERLGEGYAEKSVALMFDGIRQSISTLTLDKMIGGLGIDGVGKITGKLLAEHFLSLEAFNNATIDELLLIDGIGDIMARNILEFLGEDGHIGDYTCLFVQNGFGFNTVFQAAEKLGSSLEGLTVIFTGTSYRFKRDEIKTFFAGHGAKYVGSVSGKVNYVIVGDAPGQNKIDKARQLGVEVIPERDFYEKYGI